MLETFCLKFDLASSRWVIKLAVYQVIKRLLSCGVDEFRNAVERAPSATL